METSGTRPRHERTRSSLVLLTVSLVLAMLAGTTGVVDAQEDRVDRVAPTDVRAVAETLRLACAPDFVNGERGVVCQWSEATNPNTRAYRLYRITNGSARELVTTVAAEARLGYFDTGVSAPSDLVYGVVALNHNGRVIAQSAPVNVRYGHEVDQLRLDCARDFIDEQRGVLCRWSATDQQAARGYLLYRIADGDAREVIARTGRDGRLAYFDTDVVPDMLYTYGVTAVDGAGTVLAVGGPRVVRWPTAD